jgi:hypothetical protein
MILVGCVWKYMGASEKLKLFLGAAVKSRKSAFNEQVLILENKFCGCPQKNSAAWLAF